jgi:hypothetical protein
MRATSEWTIDTLRAALPAEVFRIARAEGRAMTEPQSIAFAMEDAARE